MEVLIALAIVAGATVIILNLNRFARRAPFSVSRLDYINIQSKHQVLLLGGALLVLFVTYFVNEANFVAYFVLGDIGAPAKAVAWLGIQDGLSWLSLGIGLSFVITLATITFVFFQFRKSGGGLSQLVPFIPWVVLFSVTNSFAEEVVYRLGIIVPLAGTIDSAYILLISAAAFGAPHLRGMPSGIVGALMAGLLGWFLAKSVVETTGIFWAWFIHFLQDVVIFSGFVMTSVSKSLERGSK